MKRTYSIGQFAKKAYVSVRTLRYYDQVGLLSPSHYSEAGYRLYTDEDFPRLQQILGLKYLGFSLEEIRQCLQIGPRAFREALAVQKAMLQERKAHLEAIIRTIEGTESRLAESAEDWEPVIQIMEVIRMQERKEWIHKYFSDEQARKLEEISAASYTTEDRQKLDEWGQNWSEEDQREADRKWGELYAEVRRLANDGQDPAGPEAQALAARQAALVGEFTRGDPGITAGLQKLWQKMGELPAGEAPLPRMLSPEQEAFWNRAMAIYQEQQA